MNDVIFPEGEIQPRPPYTRKLMKVIPMSMRIGSMASHEARTPEEALDYYYKNEDWKTIRFGQHVCNYYSNVPHPWPELFHETNVIDAMHILRRWCEGKDD